MRRFPDEQRNYPGACDALLMTLWTNRSFSITGWITQRVSIRHAQAAIEIVEQNVSGNQRLIMSSNRFGPPGSCPDRLSFPGSPWHSPGRSDSPQADGGFQRVDDVQVMGPASRPSPPTDASWRRRK